MTLFTGRHTRTTLFGILLAGVLGACGGEAPLQGGVMINGVVSDAHCPYHDPIRVQTDTGIATYDTLPLVGPITSIPEFHDCQRFIDSEGRNYGPLIGIFAVQTLASFDVTPATPTPALDFREVFLSEGSPELVRARTRLPTGTGTPVDLGTRVAVNPRAQINPGAQVNPRTQVASLPAGYPIGIIVDFDRIPYDRLGIKPGVNCLYVYPDSHGPHGLGARVVPVGPDIGGCARPLSDGTAGTELQVFTKRMPGDDPSDYPPVARWDWDQSSSTQYIGIRCGRRWCEIGPKTNFTRSATYLYTIADRKERRVFAVKGWHDDQWLARTGSAGLYAQPFRGTIVPVKDLADFDATTFATPAWVEVARVSISPQDPVYETKFHFTTAAMPEKMNRIALCQGSWTDCLAADRPPPISSAPPKCATADDRWWARITNTRGEKFYKCVNRVVNAGVTMPGTARWLWSDTDEWIWVECDQGCCQVQSGDK